MTFWSVFVNPVTIFFYGVLMNDSIIGPQFCTDSVYVQQDGDDQVGRNKLAIIPRLNFTCNGRIASIRARVKFNDNRNDYPFFQVWRASSINSKVYNKIGEVQLQSDDQVTGSGDYQTANIPLTGNNTIEVQSGDVVGYYHPPDARYQVRTIETDGYILYQFDGSPKSVDLNNNDGHNNRQPLIQFTIGKCVPNVAYVQNIWSNANNKFLTVCYFQRIYTI